MGVAIADLGYVAAAFAWVWMGEELTTWESRSLLGRAASGGEDPVAGSRWRGRGAALALGDRGEMVVDVPTERGRLSAQVGTGVARPATLVTKTSAGGWNVTEKAAGYATRGAVTVGKRRAEVSGWGWRDWTVGRQDRHTVWRWAAGAGAVAGRDVGINVSTGMNAAGEGEDVVWWDGQPYPIEVKDLAALDDGRWVVRGPDWTLEFRSVAQRAANERFGPFMSRYVQPLGVFEGTLPTPEGPTAEVRFWGVTEDHEARW